MTQEDFIYWCIMVDSRVFGINTNSIKKSSHLSKDFTFCLFCLSPGSLTPTNKPQLFNSTMVKWKIKKEKPHAPPLWSIGFIKSALPRWYTVTQIQGSAHPQEPTAHRLHDSKIPHQEHRCHSLDWSYTGNLTKKPFDAGKSVIVVELNPHMVLHF